jgi:hypothetical protein
MNGLMKGGADSLLIIIIFMCNNRVGYQALLYVFIVGVLMQTRLEREIVYMIIFITMIL